MKSRKLSVPLFVIAAVGCFAEAGTARSVYSGIGFCGFGLICLAGIVFRWGPLISATLLAFFFGQALPDKHGYSHDAMEGFEHDFLDPTLLAVTVAVLLTAENLYSVRSRKKGAEDDQQKQSVNSPAPGQDGASKST